VYMTHARVDDVVFSYAKGHIRAVGFVTGFSRDSGRPLDFGPIGTQWDNAGWLVPVRWQRLDVPFSPKSKIEKIAPLLPSKYSPIQAGGNGNQKFYLTRISDALGELLLELVRFRPSAGFNDDLYEHIDNEQESIIHQASISETEKNQLIKARRGQGIFRYRVLTIEDHCRMTAVPDGSLLIASHIKPWRDSTNSERLDGNNGLLLSPHADQLFDAGRISFGSDGQVLTRDDETRSVMQMWALDYTRNVGTFTEGQKKHLHYHRTVIFGAPQ